MNKIKGLDLRAKDENGKEIKSFKVVFINDFAYGETNSGSTDRNFVELYVNPARPFAK